MFAMPPPKLCGSVPAYRSSVAFRSLSSAPPPARAPLSGGPCFARASPARPRPPPRAFRAGAVRAPDCARGGGRTYPLRKREGSWKTPALCHEMSCSSCRRRSPAVPFLHIALSVPLRSTPFRPRRRPGRPKRRDPFCARILRACPCAGGHVSAGAVRAPDCARETADAPLPSVPAGAFLRAPALASLRSGQKAADEPEQAFVGHALGICRGSPGRSLTAPPLPHHRAYGSVHGGSTDLSCGTASQGGEAEPVEDSRRAFGVGTRHTGFGPSVSGAPGFTPRLRLQGQFQLDVLPLGPHEPAVLITLSVVRAFAGGPATMPSADFCAAITALAEPLSPGVPDTTQTSRGKTNRLHRTPAGFTTPALDGCGLRDRLLARPAG